jgi:hypothetical protein
MKQNALAWIVGALAVLVVAAVTFWLGYTLLPTRTTAQTIGTIVPWYLTWGMIWMTLVISVIIAVNLFVVGLNGGPALPTPVSDRQPPRSTPDARLR